jgi:uncharacterized membrane protein YhaH (DUF805 family)
MPPVNPEAANGQLDGATDPADLSRPLYGASFGQAIKRFFGQYANFSGRASRSEYWWIALFSFLVSLIPTILMSVGMGMGAAWAASHTTTRNLGAGYTYEDTPGIIEAPGAGALLIIGSILLFIFALAIIVPSLAIAWRRLHDANLAGPFYFLVLVPGVGGIVILILTLLASNPAGRRFDRRA